jgi:hypothetical protein
MKIGLQDSERNEPRIPPHLIYNLITNPILFSNTSQVN